MKRGWLLLLLSLLMAGGVAVWGHATRGSDGRGPSSPVMSLREEVVAPGRVEGRGRTLNLAFDQSGRIVDLPVEEGQSVKKGELLGRLDDRMVRARVAQAEATLLAVRARRDLAYKGSLVDEIRAAEAEADAARAQANNETVERGRAERLLHERAITTAETDRVRASADAATARLAAAEARLSVLRQGARGELKRAATADVAAAEAALQEAEVALSQTQLLAPIAGIVVRRYVDVGEQASMVPPTVVLSMANIERLRLRAEVDEEDIARVSTGNSGYARAEAYGERRFPGRIIQVMREVGRKGPRNDDDPRTRVDTRVLEVLFEFDVTPDLPVGLRMDLHLASHSSSAR